MTDHPNGVIKILDDNITKVDDTSWNSYHLNFIDSIIDFSDTTTYFNDSIIYLGDLLFI